MVVKINIDALKTKKKSRTNEAEIGKKLKTASLNSRFTGSEKQRVYFHLLTFEKFWNLNYC